MAVVAVVFALASRAQSRDREGAAGMLMQWLAIFPSADSVPPPLHEQRRATACIRVCVCAMAIDMLLNSDQGLYKKQSLSLAAARTVHCFAA